MTKAYLNLLTDVLTHGIRKDDRTGTGTYSVFGRMYRHDLNEGFPLLTTKKVHAKSIIHELLWFLNGDANIQYLKDNKVSIWDEWAHNNELGPVYGVQWRKWPAYQLIEYDDPDALRLALHHEHDGYQHIGDVCDVAAPGKAKAGLYYKALDQVQRLIDGIKKSPNSRRHIINAWNVAYLPDESASHADNVMNRKMALPPCHVMYQFYVENGKLSCMLTQRSGDLFLGVPFNCASVAFLTHMVAQQCDLGVGEIIHTIGDLHIYSNHVEQVRLQLTREPRVLPKLILKRKPESIFDYQFDDFELVGYDPHPGIAAPIAV